MKILMWTFIKLTFKYALIKKLDYNIDSLDDIESFYDEIYALFLTKFEIKERVEAKNIDAINLSQRLETTEEENIFSPPQISIRSFRKSIQRPEL